MFTGIVQGVAQIASVVDDDGIRTFAIEFPEGFTEGLSIGGSVSVDGVCLTATNIPSARTVLFDVILQSLSVTTLASYSIGDNVNVERAAKDGAEIGGHPLSGHIDFSAEVQHAEENGGNKVLRISIPDDFKRYVFSKGYIAVNGASLTVSECSRADGWFEIWLIPETRRATTLNAKLVGERVNIEIERGTQVMVDTVRDTVTEVLGNLRPALDALLRERGLTLDELVTPTAILPPQS